MIDWEQMITAEQKAQIAKDQAAIPLPWLAKLKNIDPRDKAFGMLVSASAGDAAQNGAAMDLALQAVLADNLPLYIPPGKTYLNAAEINTEINESDFRVYGEGAASLLTVLDNAPLFTVDGRADERYRHELHDFSVDFLAATFDQTRLYQVKADDTVYGGLRASKFYNITSRGPQKVFDFEPTALIAFGGLLQTPGYAFLQFTSLQIPQYTRYPNRVIHFHSGHGAHTMVTNSQLRADPTAGISFESGDGESLIGDFIFAGNHVVLGDYGIKLNGPTNRSKYSSNNQIVGNQFDVMTTGIGWLANIDNPILDNAGLYGTAQDWRLDNCLNVDIRDIGAAQGRHGVLGKTLGNGTHTIWTISRSEATRTKATIRIAVDFSVEAPSLNARHVYRNAILTCNSGTWTVQNITGPIGNDLADLTLALTPSGDSVLVQAIIANAAGAGKLTGQATLVGDNRKVAYN